MSHWGGACDAMRFIGRLVVRAAAWAAGLFYRLERTGPGIPGGPVIVVTNHPNMLMDPLLALKTAGRRVRILAKAPLFDIPVFGHVMRSVDTLPLYRVQDDPDQLHRNRLAIQEAVETLCAGGALLMFPEGKSHSQPAIAPLKSGVARMALEAEIASGWNLAVKVVPLGLAYQRKQRFRSRVVAGVGEPIEVRDWRQQCERDRSSALRSLTDAVASGLAGQTLNLADESDRDLVETADILYARAKGLASWREREPFKERLPRLQGFADQFAWLRAADSPRWQRLYDSLADYRRWLKVLGSGDADIPPRYEIPRVARYVVREALTLGLALPFAALGAIAWYLAYFATGLVARIVRPNIETLATVKLLAGIVLYPATYVGWTAAAALIAGGRAAVATALALPPLGLAALYWRGRRAEVWEDVRTFFQVVRRPELRQHLAEQRTALADELDALARDWAAAGEGRRVAPGDPC